MDKSSGEEFTPAIITRTDYSPLLSRCLLYIRGIRISTIIAVFTEEGEIINVTRKMSFDFTRRRLSSRVSARFVIPRPWDNAVVVLRASHCERYFRSSFFGPRENYVRSSVYAKLYRMSSIPSYRIFERFWAPRISLDPASLRVAVRYILRLFRWGD